MSKRINRASWLRNLTSYLNRCPRSQSPIPRRVRLEQLESRAMLTLPAISFNPSTTTDELFTITEFAEGAEGNLPFLFEVGVSDVLDGGSVVEVIFSLDNSFDDADDVIFDNDPLTDPDNLPGDKYEVLPPPDMAGTILVTHSFDWSTLNDHDIFDDGYALYHPNIDNLGFWVQAKGSNDGSAANQDEASLEVLEALPFYVDYSVTGGDASPCGANPVVIDVEASETFPRDTQSVTIVWTNTTFPFEETSQDVPFNSSTGHYELTTSALEPATYVYLIRLTDSDGDIEEPIFDVLTVEEGDEPVDPPINGVVLTPCGDLLVGGTTDADTFAFTPTGTPGELKVVLNGANQGNFSPIGIVQIFGSDGADAITINGDSTANQFEVHDGTLVLNGLVFDDDQVESRTINARGSGDTITVTGGSATVTGGAGSDTLNVTGAVVLTAAHAGTVNGMLTFTSIENLVGDGASDTLTGRDVNNVWKVDAPDSGSVGSLDFSGFESLQGGSANDTFRLTEGVTSSINIDGGNATANDKLDYAAWSTAINVDLSGGTATGWGVVSGIENVAGGDGNDIIRGDGGNNMLAGNQGADIIHGGGGNDTINGNAGRDLLIGGHGADTILGNGDEDILIAGWTDYDDDGNDIAFNALLAEWVRTNANSSYLERVDSITDGGGLNGSFVLVGSAGPTPTVFDDGDADTLTGNGGKDWFFANVGEDVVTDQSASELWDDTDF